MALIVLRGGQHDGQTVDYDIEQQIYYVHSAPVEVYRQVQPRLEVETSQGFAVVYAVIPSP